MWLLRGKVSTHTENQIKEIPEKTAEIIVSFLQENFDCATSLWSNKFLKIWLDLWNRFDVRSSNFLMAFVIDI